MTPNEMSLDQCRDWLAREDGWVTEQDHAIQKDGTLRPLIAWTHKATNREKIWVHPYPTTIDGAAGRVDGKCYLVLLKGGSISQWSWKSEDGHDGWEVDGVTAWADLPSPPAWANGGAA